MTWIDLSRVRVSENYAARYPDDGVDGVGVRGAGGDASPALRAVDGSVLVGLAGTVPVWPACRF